MKEESFTIENVQNRISEYQKKIQLNYTILHHEELEESESMKLIEEINMLKELVYGLQNQLKQLYTELFSGKRKAYVTNG